MKFYIGFVLTLLLPQLINLIGDNVQHRVEAKTFMRCELTNELLRRPKIQRTFLSIWVCLIEHESNRRTDKITRKNDGSSEYGLFQIGSNRYCRPNRNGGVCQRKCEEFLDDRIDDDIECAMNIFNREGFKHWQSWNSTCHDPQNLPRLDVLCNLRSLLGRHWNFY